MDRRSLLKAALGAVPAGAVLPQAIDRASPPRIAAVVTEYRENSHADVIVTKFLEGCRALDLNYEPKVRIASLYMDQFPVNDLGKGMAARHKLHLADTIEGALTLGTGKLAVDGVLLIGEHGRYPYNEAGQHLYPRRRFFEAAAGVMRASGRAVPVFNDKHLAHSWADARAMYDMARELKIPFMAGSSIPVAWRKPEVELPAGAEVEDAVMVGYGGTEAYGFHTLEGLQCMLERRRGGETGVKSVQCLSGDAVWDAGERGVWNHRLLLAALARSEKPGVAAATLSEVKSGSVKPEAFLIEYRDGVKAACLMLYGFVEEFLFAARLADHSKPVTTLFWLQEGKPFAHFARLCLAIERMFLTGAPPYPVERTLLTTGVLDAAMQSRFRKGEKRLTPELDVRYRAL